MDAADVLIVGGGPAGSACAWALRDAGLDVAVIDQARFPRDKVCAGWITPEVLASLEVDPGEYARERVLQPIRAFRVGLLAGPDRLRTATDIAYPDVVSYGVRRLEFDDFLLRRARARLLTGEPLRGLARAGKGWLANDTIRAAVLVGAGGHACPVARALGARPGDEAAVVAREIEFLLPAADRDRCRVRGERPELYFCADLAGYGWCVRKGDHLNVGLGRDDRRDLAAHVRGFLDFLARERGVPAPPGRLHGQHLRREDRRGERRQRRQGDGRRHGRRPRPATRAPSPAGASRRAVRATRPRPARRGEPGGRGRAVRPGPCRRRSRAPPGDPAPRESAWL